MTLTLPSRVAPHVRRARAVVPRLGARSLTQTRPARAEEKKKKEDDEDGDEDDEDGKRTPRRTFTGPNQKWEDPPFIAWLRSTGEQFRKVTPEGRQYLGGRDTPFPLNPSFKPPVPMSDRARSRMYLEYMKGGKTIRELARGNGSISLRRAEAVIRLKHVELEMRMGRRPETSFNAVMEQALGVAAAEAAREAEEKELALEAEQEARERTAHNAGLTPEDEDWQHDEEEWLDWLENKYRPGGIGGVGGKRTFDSGRRKTMAGSSAARMAQMMQSGNKSAPLDADLQAAASGEAASEPDLPAVSYPTSSGTAAEFSRFMDDMVSAPEAPYIRMYFEPVAEEGTARPIIGDLIKKHRAKFEAKQAQRASPQLSVTHVPRRGGKTMFEFVDVGGAYKKERDIHTRDKAAERRQTVRAKKLAERSDGLRLAKAAASAPPPTA